MSDHATEVAQLKITYEQMFHSLEQENSRLSKELEAASTLLATATQENKQLSEQAASEAQLKKKQEEVLRLERSRMDELRSQASAARQQVSQLRTDLASSEHQSASLRASVGSLQGTLDQVTASLRAREDALHKLEDEKFASSLELERAQREAAASKSREESLAEELRLREGDLAALTARLGGERAALEQRVEQAEAEAAALNTRVQRMSLSESELAKECEQLQRSLRQEKLDHADEVGLLRSEVSSLQSLNEQLEEQLKETEGQAASFLRQEEEWKEQIEARDAEISRLKDQVEDARVPQNEDSLAVIEQIVSECGGATKDRQDVSVKLAARLEASVRELHAVSMEKQRLQDNLNELIEQIEQRAPAIQSIRAQFEASVSHREQLRAQLARTQQQATALKVRASEAERTAQVEKVRAQKLSLQVQTLLHAAEEENSQGLPRDEGTFLTVQELQQSNAHLVGEVERLSRASQDALEQATSEKLEEAMGELRRLRAQRQEQKEILEKMVAQRHVFASLLEEHQQQGGGSSALFEVDPTILEQKRELEAELKTRAHTERQLINERSDLQVEISKLRAQLDYSEKRAAIAEKESERASAERQSATETMSQLRERLVAAERRAESAMAATTQERSSAERARSQTVQAEADLKVSIAAEERAREHVRQVERERETLNQLLEKMQRGMDVIASRAGSTSAEDMMMSVKAEALKDKRRAEEAVAQAKQVELTAATELASARASWESQRIALANELQAVKEQRAEAVATVAVLRERPAIVSSPGAAAVEPSSDGSLREALEEAKMERENAAHWRSVAEVGEREFKEVSARLQAQVNTLQEQRAAEVVANEALKSASQQHEARSAQLQTALRHAAVKVKALEDHVKVLEEAAGRASSEGENYRKALEQHGETAKKLGEAEHRAANASAVVARLQAELSTLAEQRNGDLARAQKRNEELKQDLELEQSRVTSARATIETLEAALQLHGREDASASSQEQLSRFAKRESQIAEKRLDLAKVKMQQLATSLQMAERARDEARERATIAEEAAREARASSRAHEEAKRLQEELDMVRESREELRREVSRVRAQLNDVMEAERAQRQVLDPLQRRSQQLESECNGLRSERDSLKTQLEKYQRRVQQLLTKYDAVDPAKVGELQAEVAELRSQLQEMQRANAEIAGQKRSKDKKFKELLDMSRKLELAKNQAEKAAADSSAQLSEANQQIGQLQSAAQQQPDESGAKEELKKVQAQLNTVVVAFRKQKVVVEKQRQDLAAAAAAAAAPRVAALPAAGQEAPALVAPVARVSSPAPPVPAAVVADAPAAETPSIAPLEVDSEEHQRKKRIRAERFAASAAKAAQSAFVPANKRGAPASEEVQESDAKRSKVVPQVEEISDDHREQDEDEDALDQEPQQMEDGDEDEYEEEEDEEEEEAEEEVEEEEQEPVADEEAPAPAHTPVTLCRNFSSNQTCKFGRRCHYRHSNNPYAPAAKHAPVDPQGEVQLREGWTGASAPGGPQATRLRPRDKRKATEQLQKDEQFIEAGQQDDEDPTGMTFA